MPVTQFLNHIFKASWEDVSLASWQKYPCKDRPDVLGLDIVNKDFDPSTGVLKATRITFIKERLPTLMEKIFGPGYCICVEDSIVDPHSKVMVLKSQNVSFRNLVSLKETCTYTVDKENPNWTHLAQQAEVVAFPFGVSRAIERFMGDKFVVNAEKGKLIMENAIVKVRDEAEGAYEKLRQDTEEAFAAIDKVLQPQPAI